MTASSMEVFLITASYLTIGVILRRIPQVNSETGNVLNSFVIHVSLPAVVLLKIPELSFSSDLLTPALLPWVMLGVSSAAVLCLSKLFAWQRQVTGSLLLLVPLGNTSFLGIPMVKAFFGDGGVPYAVLYDQLGSFLALATYGSIIIAAYGEASAPTLKQAAKKIITFPPFIALLGAFAFRPLQYPAIAVSMLQALGATLVPVVMIAVGFQLTLCLSKESRAPLIAGLVLKLAVAPAFALVLCRALGLEGEAVRVSIFEAGMPPMVSAGALAMLAGLSPSLTASLVGLGILLSFATLPLLHFILGYFIAY
ncbi:MAG: AEC family transporter [Pseudomonadota bacterium]